MKGNPTSTLEYAKILVPVKVMRAGTQVGEALGRSTGVLEPFVKPHQIIVLTSSATKKRKIKIRIHKNDAALRNPEKPTAVHLNWHGSGWILRGLGTDAAFIKHVLASPHLASYPLTILDCDYAKSPEWPCPSDAQDARDAYEYVLANPELYDLDRITVSGFSAGGTIALGLSVALGAESRLSSTGEGEKKKKTFVHPIKGVFSVYPVATWQGPRDVIMVPKHLKDMPGMVLPLWFSYYITNSYLFHPKRNVKKWTKQQEEERREELMAQPSVSPACGLLSDFSPEVVLITAEYDHLTRPTEELRRRLEEEPSVNVYGYQVPDVGHGWDQLVRKGQHGYEERELAYELGAKLIARVGGLEVDL